MHQYNIVVQEGNYLGAELAEEITKKITRFEFAES